MTVCIAAIAEEGKKLILAADNMMTHIVGNNVQYQREDPDYKKIIKLNNNVYALAAGVLHVISPVIAAVIPDVKSTSTPQEVAEILRAKLQDFYIKKAEEEILKPLLINLQIFREQQRGLSDTLLSQVLTKLGNFNLDINIVIAGINQQTGNAYIGMVAGNGFLLDKTLDGAVTNGSGGELARFSILLSDYKNWHIRFASPKEKS